MEFLNLRSLFFLQGGPFSNCHPCGSPWHPFLLLRLAVWLTPRLFPALQDFLTHNSSNTGESLDLGWGSSSPPWLWVLKAFHIIHHGQNEEERQEARRGEGMKGKELKPCSLDSPVRRVFSSFKIPFLPRQTLICEQRYQEITHMEDWEGLVSLLLRTPHWFGRGGGKMKISEK